MNIASSSSAVVAASSNPNDTEIRELKAKRDRVEAKRELVMNLLELDEVQRPDFIDNNQDYEGLRPYITNDKLMEKENRLDQQESRLSAEIHDLRTVSSGKYPIVTAMFLYTSTLTQVCF